MNTDFSSWTDVTVRCAQCKNPLQIVFPPAGGVTALPCPAHPRAEWWITGVLPGGSIASAGQDAA